MNFRGGIRGKNSTEKSVINLLVMKFLDSRTFLIYRSVPQRNFSAPRQKIFDGKSWYYVLMHEIFRYLTFETLWNIRWFLKNFFGTVRQKNRRKTVICIKVFQIPNILKLGSGSQEFFAYSETIKFVWKTWFSVLMHRKFRNPNFSWRLEWLPTQFFSTVSPEKSMEKRDTPYWL